MPVKHIFLIEFDVNDCSQKSQPTSLKMEEKFQDEETRDNNNEYNSLVSAYSKAYPGIPALQVTKKAKTMWAKLRERYAMGMLFIFN